MSQNQNFKRNKILREMIYVLDASSIYNGILKHNLIGLKILPECTITEIKGMLRGDVIIEEVLLYEDLIVSTPEQEFFTKVKELAITTGDIEELSECDLAVLAIALSIQSQKKNVKIISDDYDIQNLASHIGLSFSGVHWKGITATYKYLWSCVGCGKTSKVKQTTCLECGSEMKKRIIKKQKLKKKGG